LIAILSEEGLNKKTGSPVFIGLFKGTINFSFEIVRQNNNEITNLLNAVYSYSFS